MRWLRLCLALWICGCSSKPSSYRQWMTPNDKIKVLTTTAMIGDLVDYIGGDQVDTMVLISGELDPHSYQLVKGDDEKLAFAHLIFFNGLNLEHGPSLHHALYNQSNAVGLGDRLLQERPESILTCKGEIDPHIWMDTALWAHTIPIIVEALSRCDPTHATLFAHNGAQLDGQLQALHLELRNELQAIPVEKRYLVTSHDAFNYFARAYLATDAEIANENWQMRFAAPEGLSADSQLSTYDIKRMIDHLTTYRIQVLFPESNLSHDSINKIVEAGREKGLNLTIADCPLYADTMGPKGSNGDTYMKMVAHNAHLIALFLRDYNPRKSVTCE